MTTPPHDAVILAGGRGARLGGVSKADLRIGGERLLDLALRAASGAATTVVVGDVAVPPGVLLTRERPPLGGPAAGLLAGLDAVADPAPWTLVLACDLPDAVAITARLRAALPPAPPDADGLVLTDATSTPQHLAALYRTASLRRAFAAAGDPTGRSMRSVLDGLTLLPVAPGAARPDDVDTPEQLARWEASVAEPAAWRAFVEDACAHLGLDAARVDERAVLRLTRRVAHAGARPMAPVAAHLWGSALATHPDADPTDLAARLAEALASAPIPEEP